jgi:hypothetical protein
MIESNNIPEDEKIGIDGTLWVKGEVEEKIYFWTNRPAVVIKVSNPIVLQNKDSSANFIPSTLMYLDALALGGGNNPETDPNNPNAPPVPPENPPESQFPITNICGLFPETVVANIQSVADAHATNNAKFQGKAVIPTAAAVPMKSNLLRYGPYASDSFIDPTNYGGVELKVENDLCPWVYGSIPAMNIAGSLLANTSNLALSKAETGQVTVPGLPDFNLGQVLGSSGPNITSISCTLGTNGVTTTYEFRTFTPKLGQLSRLSIEQFKSSAMRRAEQLKTLKIDRINQNKISRKLNTITKSLNSAQKSLTDSVVSQPSLNRILIGEIYDWSHLIDEQYTQEYKTQRSIVGTTTLAKSTAEMVFEYDKKSYMSMDGIFSPVSISGGGVATSSTERGWITPFGVMKTIDKSIKSAPILPVPPVKNKINLNEAHNLSINSSYLNPVTNPFASGDHHHIGSGLGHCIELVGKGSGISNTSLNSLTDLNSNDKYAKDYRFLGLRGPLVLHSWGYDLEGKPIPNAIDDEIKARSGIFIASSEIDNNPTSTGLKDAFLNDWLQKPATWPVGPVDLRFDRQRGVWVSPPSHKIVVVESTSDIPPYSSGSGVLINQNISSDQKFGDNIFDKEGKIIKADIDVENNDTIVTIADRLGLGVGNGDKGYAFFDGFSSEYLLLGGLGISVRIGKFCNQWPSLPNVKDPKNAIKKVILYKVGSANAWDLQPEMEIVNGSPQPRTVEVLNIFANVAAAEYQTKWCAFIKLGPTYFLIAAEC